MRSLFPAAAAALLCGHASVCASDSALIVISYDEGTGAAPGFTDPDAALGLPTRFTGVGVWPGVVSPFNPPYMPGEIVSIGTGGTLVLELARDVPDDPANPFGIDLLIFANGFFMDEAFPGGVVGPLFAGSASVDVSFDGIAWETVPGAVAGQGLPTRGYQDSGPFDKVPGKIESDPFLPIDPAITPHDLLGYNWSALSAVYGTSAGGLGIDIAASGLSAVRYVRISVAADAPGALGIDAVTIVRPALAGDLNGDGAVDFADLLILLAAWGACPEAGACSADLTGDGTVDFNDLLDLLSQWS